MSDKEDKVKELLKQVVEHFDKEDRAVRERQIRTWRRLKLYWEGFQRVWWNEVAHDWKVYDEQMAAESSSDQGYYDKPINIFRALLETIIAALSVSVPGVVCYPDDAENPLDAQTAKAGTKIAKLLGKHNDLSLLWLHSLYIWCTEGMVACYNYSKPDEALGTYEVKEYDDEKLDKHICPECGTQLEESLFAKPEMPPMQPGMEGQEQPGMPQEGMPQEGQEQPPSLEDSVLVTNQELDEYGSDDNDAELHNLLINEHEIVCPNCAVKLDPDLQKTPLVIPRLVGVTQKAKSRQCMEAYGGLNVKIPVYAMKQEDCPYLILAYEIHYSQMVKEYDHLKKEDFDIKTSAGGMYEPYERWGRLNPQYNGEYPTNVITKRQCWLRPWAFNVLKDDEAKILKEEFPDGVKVVFANEIYAEAVNQKLDDFWTIRHDPLSDYLHHDPLGMLLINVQDITNEIISLTVQTMEHGISQTFADPAIVNFAAYKQQEVAPGMIIPTKAPRTGQKVADGFFETKTASLSGEVMPFSQKIQEFGQFVSGALPSLWGGSLSGSDTASEYSMSRSQALQRLQNIWKTLLVWWKHVNAKAINSFIKDLESDEKYVSKDEKGEFYNVFIRKSELQGKIGNIELEASENLPLTWGQRNGILLQLMQNPNPAIMQMLMDPVNIDILKEALGLEDIVVPGENDRQKQYEEILQLVNSEPIPAPQQPQMPGMPPGMPPQQGGQPPQPDMMGGQSPQAPPPPPEDEPSVPIDPDVDNHAIEAQICRHWLVSDAGRLAKVENQAGYKNVLLHMKQHLMAMQPPPGMQPQGPPPNESGQTPPAPPEQAPQQQGQGAPQ